MSGVRIIANGPGESGWPAGAFDNVVEASHGDGLYERYSNRARQNCKLHTENSPYDSYMDADAKKKDRARRLKLARQEAGLDGPAAAIAVHNWQKNSYPAHENGNASFSFEQAQTYADAYGVGAEWLYSGRGPKRPNQYVKVIGRVGADPEGRIIRTAADEPADTVPLPAGATTDSVALLVDGHSMGKIIEDGSLIYFENQETPPSEDLYGEKVVVQLAGDGDDTSDPDVLVKILRRGRKPDHYDLESINGPTMHDVKIRWAAEIIHIVPPRQAKRLIRRGIA